MTMRLFAHQRLHLGRGNGRFGARVLCVCFAIAVGAEVAVAQAKPVFPPIVNADSLLGSDVASDWQQLHSAHFSLYMQSGISFPLSSKALLDSLEEAWTHDTALLDVPSLNAPPVIVLVTHSWRRFPTMLAPGSGGLMRRDTKGGSLIILVHNDSLRAFTRHEVMHVVSYAAWGPTGAPWVDEGLATFADGRCQATTVLAVARDLLRAEPGFSATDLDARYRMSAGPVLGRRHRAYVLAASMVSFVYARGGASAVRILRRDGIPLGVTSVPAESLTAAWRNYVERSAAGEQGLSSEALDARGCN